MDSRQQFTILLVDDDRTNLDVLCGILRPDYNVLLAKTGGKALILAREKKPDLVLLDIIMPDMDGYSVLTALKNSDETHDIPVIFLTGLISVTDEEKGFLLGAVDYIVKPFNHSILKARIRTHMRIVRQMRLVEKLGMIDGLTNIANRRHFDQRMQMEWASAIREKTPVSLLMIDVDHFKHYNDSFGHPQGDLALQSLARLLERMGKRPADFPARFGGEEFAFILPQTPHQGAIAMAEQIREAVARMKISSTSNMAASCITISIGVATASPGPGDSLDSFLAAADSLLYQAKHDGRNRVCAFPAA